MDPWVGKTPWRKKWQPTPAFLPGKSHGQRNLVGYSPWGCKELDPTEQLNTIPSCMGTWDPSAPPAWSPSSLLFEPSLALLPLILNVSDDVMHTHGLNSLLTQRYASSPDVSELQTHISACLVETSTWTRLKPVQMELSISHLFQRTRQLPLFLFSGNSGCPLLVTTPWLSPFPFSFPPALPPSLGCHEM